MSFSYEGLNLTRIEGYLAEVVYPARQAELIRYVKDNGAPGDVLEMLERLPDRMYTSPADVIEELHRLGS